MSRMFGVIVGLVCGLQLVAGVSREAQAQLDADGGLVMKSITIEGSASDDALLSFFPSPVQQIVFRLQAHTGSFLISGEERVSILEISENLTAVSVQTARVSSLVLHEALSVGGVRQWLLVTQESYQKSPAGWSDNAVTSCGGVHMLGGYGKQAGGELTKTFEGFPPHSTVRLVATYHFIDAWSGESGFARANNGKQQEMQYVWTDKYDFGKSQSGIDICGASYIETKFATNIDVTFPHTADALTLGFGSTLDNDPFENSFGVSNLQIYIR